MMTLTGGRKTTTAFPASAHNNVLLSWRVAAH